MVTIKNDNQFDRYIVSHIIECQTENIKFQNIVFDCKTITDAKGNVFSVQRTGRWTKNDNGTYSCDQCHSWIPNEQHYYARYCIFCGARMEVEDGTKA